MSPNIKLIENSKKFNGQVTHTTNERPRFVFSCRIDPFLFTLWRAKMLVVQGMDDWVLDETGRANTRSVFSKNTSFRRLARCVFGVRVAENKSPACYKFAAAYFYSNRSRRVGADLGAGCRINHPLCVIFLRCRHASRRKLGDGLSTRKREREKKGEKVGERKRVRERERARER